MNTVLLHPTDVLFFRDGRPMSGSLAGHGAAWPLPNVINSAFHAALHRAHLPGAHAHDHRDLAGNRAATDSRKYGSLVTAGPFPVHVPESGQSLATWYLPRPLDLVNASLTPALCPTAAFDSAFSSLPDPLEYAVANQQAPSKGSGTNSWISRAAYERYLHAGDSGLKGDEAIDDGSFCDAEHSIGIGIDSERHVQDGESFYSAHYLRLRDHWKMGVLAQTDDKINGSTTDRQDLIQKLLKEEGRILVGGQQRICTASYRSTPHRLELPRGKQAGFAHVQRRAEKRFLVKWILLSPAVWPRIEADPSREIIAHPGGWLPNWIAAAACPFEGTEVGEGSVLLLDGPGREKARRKRLTPGKRIVARLVAAIVSKPIPVTGWALKDEAAGRAEAGAKSTLLAVPAGAVYYFEADSEPAAIQLATALNWHGDQSEPTTLRNRRSTLLGEKGFGLGVCGTWQFHDVPGHPAP